MPNTVCLSGPAFSLTGDAYFLNMEVSFQVIFNNQTDEETVLAYEWYLDNALLAGQNSAQFAGQISCGDHAIGVRILSGEGWSGVKYLQFATCKLPLSLLIYGPDAINEGDSASYYVLQLYSDGSTMDITGQYTFASTDGGSFIGNVFTAVTDDTNFNPFQVTISAIQNGIEQLSKQITVNNTTIRTGLGVLVVDLYNDSSLDVIGLIDNAEVMYNHVPAYTGKNIVPISAAPSVALVLASDLNAPAITNWRFEFNLAKLVADYPQTQNFVFYIKGRSTVAGKIFGSFAAKSIDAQMTLINSPGSYMPTVSGGIDIVPQTSFSSTVVAGANNSYNEKDLTMIISFNYNVPNNLITYTTRDQPIVVNDFDFMAIKYHWLNGAGSDLDTLTGFENNGTVFDHLYVGYGQPNATVPANTVPQSDAYLWWGSDNTSSTGFECILIGINKFIADLPASPNVVEVGLYAAWYGVPISGDFTVELVTYKGGTMSLQGTDFINTGGVLVSSDTIPVNTLIRSQSHTPETFYKVGTLKYNKATQSAIIEIH